jgi:pyrrolidone-carboxylate peptidase
MMPSQDYLNVVVTGNPPFMEYDFNTSQLVRDALPDVIERPGKRSIRILKYHRDTLDTYEDVRFVSNDIWGGKRSRFLPAPQPGEKEEHVDVDFILHLGMIALGWDPDQFRFETLARRDGYKLSGDDGNYVDSDYLKSLGLPEVLSTSLDVAAGWHKVKEDHPDVTSCVSDDAGLYFCEFRLYSSLAEPYVTKEFANKKGRVVFEHLPQVHTKEGIDLARDISVSFITGLADDAIFSGN